MPSIVAIPLASVANFVPLMTLSPATQHSRTGRRKDLGLCRRMYWPIGDSFDQKRSIDVREERVDGIQKQLFGAKISVEGIPARRLAASTARPLPTVTSA